MKFSSKVELSCLSPMRKFHPYAVAAEAKGKKIYHLNIGQPDIETPKAYFDAVKHFDLPVLAQCRPGDKITFTAVTVEPAHQEMARRPRALFALRDALEMPPGLW